MAEHVVGGQKEGRDVRGCLDHFVRLPSRSSRLARMKVESGMTWHGVSNKRHVVLVPGERDIQAPRVS